MKIRVLEVVKPHPFRERRVDNSWVHIAHADVNLPDLEMVLRNVSVWRSPMGLHRATPGLVKGGGLKPATWSQEGPIGKALAQRFGEISKQLDSAPQETQP